MMSYVTKEFDEYMCLLDCLLRNSIYPNDITTIRTSSVLP